MGSARGDPRRPSTTVYFVALAGILALLAALCCYFFYFCVSKVKELTREDSPLNQPCTNTAARQQVGYPVQKGVRDSATVMAKMCRSLPAARASAPAPARAPASPDAGDSSAADSGDPVTDSTNTNDASASATPEKLPAKPAVCAVGGFADS